MRKVKLEPVLVDLQRPTKIRRDRPLVSSHGFADSVSQVFYISSSISSI